MLDAALTQQLAAYLEKLREPIELVATLDDGAKSRELEALLETIVTLSPMISLVRDNGERIPSFTIRRRADHDVAVSFAGIPLGHEFTSLVLALLQVGGHPAKISDETAAAIRALPGGWHFETWFSLSCQNCPDVVQALNLLAILNPVIRHTAIDGALFKEEAEAKTILAVPSVFLNGQAWASGRMDLDEIIARLDTGAQERAAQAIAAKEPFDVLVVGGGPAGAAAAIYAARKGIRTGIVAERFGGQVQDTMAIENFISVSHTEGPRLAADLENHVRAYGVDIITRARVETLIPAESPGALHELHLAGGGRLKARAIVLATGARWRQLGVPGEDEYRNRGVAYCPHCDGPLFRGKRVAVVGGGNSGVEAAIDLAGITAEVTLIEYDPALRADAVLQAKLRSLPNTRIITSAKTTAVQGDGEKVTGITYEDRASGESHQIPLEGIFVQIGLVPNAEWLKGTLALSPRGEIIIDERGATSLPGVFAGGDATTTPYKQIIIAMGDGAKAALSAFDHLIRLPVPEVLAP